MRGKQYNLRQALEDLREAGFTARAHAFRQGAWHHAPVAEDLLEGLVFAGATLDSRDCRGGPLFVGLAGRHRDGRDFVCDALRDGARAALTRPWREDDADPLLSGDPGRECAVLISDRPDEALAALAAAHRRRCRATVIGVTGTNGKTTTKDLLAAILAHHGDVCATAGNHNNELGVPLTLLDIERGHHHAVVEMGASKPGDIAALCRLAAPRIGLITNASDAHLEGFGSLDAIVQTKGELVGSLPDDGAAILNADSVGYERWRDRAPCPVTSWGVETGDHRWTWRAGSDGRTGCLELDGRDHVVPLPGRHNGANLAAAILAARAAGIDKPDVRRALKGFRSSEQRSRVLRFGEILVFDDSYNANPGSLLAAAAMLAAIEGRTRRVALLGHMAELGPDSAAIHRRTGHELAAAGLDLLIGVGAEAAGLVEGFREGGGEARHCDDHDTAYAAMEETLRPGDAVLVKGSRSAAMEKVLSRYCREHWRERHES